MRAIVNQGVTPASACYGAGALAFHWTVAGLIVFLGALGLLFDEIPREARPFWINVHVCVGLIYFALVIARLLWRGTRKAPDLAADVAVHPPYVMVAVPIVVGMARAACTSRARYVITSSDATGSCCG
jgi:cytochrome b561